MRMTIFRESDEECAMEFGEFGGAQTSRVLGDLCIRPHQVICADVQSLHKADTAFHEHVQD